MLFLIVKMILLLVKADASINEIDNDERFLINYILNERKTKSQRLIEWSWEMQGIQDEEYFRRYSSKRSSSHLPRFCNLTQLLTSELETL